MNRRLIAASCAIAVSLITQQRAIFAADANWQYPQTAPVQALLAPIPGGTGTTVILEAAGFAPLETVTFRVGLADPFSGGITNPVLTIAGVTDAFGRLGDSWGSVPVPPQTLPTSLQAGIYTLEAAGTGSGRLATTRVGLPFVALSTGLHCPERPLSPGRYGFALADSTGGFRPGTEAIGVVGFPTPVSTAAPLNWVGRFSMFFHVPLATPSGTYSLLVAGLSADASQTEQLRICTLAVGAS